MTKEQSSKVDNIITNNNPSEANVGEDGINLIEDGNIVQKLESDEIQDIISPVEDESLKKEISQVDDSLKKSDEETGERVVEITREEEEKEEENNNSIIQTTPRKIGNDTSDEKIPPSIHTDSPLSPHSQIYSPTAGSEMKTPSKKKGSFMEKLMGTNESPSNATALTAPTTQSTITIQHDVTQKGGSKNRILSMIPKKLIKPIIVFVVLLTSGLASYFFSGFLTIPGLKNEVKRLEEQNIFLKEQINKLEAQVDRLDVEVKQLEVEVTRLENETDRLSLINNNINNTLIEYVSQNVKLNESLTTYDNLNDFLNLTFRSLDLTIDDLEDTVRNYTDENERLDNTVLNLTGQVNNLDKIKGNLSMTVTELNIEVDYLSNRTEELSAIRDDLNSTVMTLEDEVETITEQNNRLENLSSNLATMVSFLNETSLDIDNSMDDFVAGVAGQINVSRVLAIGSLQSLYNQQTSYWDCDFREYFLTESFVDDRDSPIGSDSYGDVLDYINERIFNELCLDEANFEEYLKEQYDTDPTNISFNTMLRAVSEYTDYAYAFYFVSEDRPDISLWADAKFTCKDLPPTAKYLF